MAGALRAVLYWQRPRLVVWARYLRLCELSP